VALPGNAIHAGSFCFKKKIEHQSKKVSKKFEQENEGK